MYGGNAEGFSAFKPWPVERGMPIAQSSHDLAIILPHDTYGNHLDDSGKTVDLELEKMIVHSKLNL